jgi:hypothetical protein
MSLLIKAIVAIAWLLALASAYGVGARSDWAGSTPGELDSLREAVQARDPVRRSFDISRSLHQLDARQLPGAARIAEEAGFWFVDQEHSLLMYAWVPIDPESAIEWAWAQPRPLDRRAKIALVDALGFFDQPRAGALLRSLGLSREAELLHEHMVRGWARSGATESLTDYIEALQQGKPRQRAVRALVDGILREGPDALIAWAESIPVDAERQFKRVTFKKSVHALAGTEPQRAAQWLEGHFGEPYAAGSTKVLMLRWPDSDPAAAMDWVATLDVEHASPDLVKKSFSSWLEIDAAAAENWALGAPPTITLDPVRRVLVRKYFDKNPAKAMAWAHRIQNRVTRLRVQASAGRAWWRSDPDAFLAWLPDSGLDAQVRDLILNTAQKEAAPAESLGADGSES